MSKKLRFLVMSVVVTVPLLLAGVANAQTLPALPVDDYADGLLDAAVQGLTQIWPYAAVFTGFAIIVGMVKRWLGHRKLTRI